jgi:hypothetical protein
MMIEIASNNILRFFVYFKKKKKLNININIYGNKKIKNVPLEQY